MKRFIADCMLGKLAKWLRVMGYDTHYQSFYDEIIMEKLIREGRLLLTRNNSSTDKYKQSFLIRSDRLNNQLIELKENGFFSGKKPLYFSRCLVCNENLMSIPINDALGSIPEYVYHQNITVIKKCRKCGRYYWPGSHRARMLDQLVKWGVTEDSLPSSPHNSG